MSTVPPQIKPSKKSRWLKWMSYWPPYWAAGIQIEKMAPDFREIIVALHTRPWNKNYFGTHFGGSLYAMVDPFFALMFVENLGKGFIVWDKAASIAFKKPGRGTVRAHFRIDQAQIDELRAHVLEKGKHHPIYVIEVRDELGNVKLFSNLKLRNQINGL